MLKNKYLVLVAFVGIFLSAFLFAQNEGKEVKLNAKDKKSLNTFFSNFSEIGLKPIEKNALLTDEDLIYFSVYHNYRNNEKAFEKVKVSSKVKIKDVKLNDAATKYFGKKIKKHQAIDGIEYNKGYYTIPEGSGEAYVFSQVTALFEKSKNTFTAYVNIYSAGSGWTGNPHGTLEEWKKKEGDEGMPEVSAKMKATIQKVTEKGKTRYILIDYNEMK